MLFFVPFSLWPLPLFAFYKFQETAPLDTPFFCLPLVPLISLFLCAEGELWTLPDDAGLLLLACFLLALGDARGCLP